MAASLDQELHLRIPFGIWQIVDVTFPSTPDTNLVIRHTLAPTKPGDVHYTVIKQTTAGVVYEALDADRKLWTPEFIVLRSDVGGWNGRLLLSLLKTSKPSLGN